MWGSPSCVGRPRAEASKGQAKWRLIASLVDLPSYLPVSNGHPRLRPAAGMRPAPTCSVPCPQNRRKNETSTEASAEPTVAAPAPTSASLSSRRSRQMEAGTPQSVILVYCGVMSSTYPIAEARTRLGDLARRAAQHEHITLTDRGTPAAVLISPAELEDLEDALAVARLERDRALGLATTAVPHADARRALLEAAGKDSQ